METSNWKWTSFQFPVTRSTSMIKISELAKKISKEEFLDFYKTHSQTEVSKRYNLTQYQIVSLAKLFGYVKTTEDIKRTKELTNLKRYGTKNSFNVHERINPFTKPEVIEKIKQTKSKNNSYKVAIEKAKETRINKYGSIKESYLLSSEKAKISNLEKYGTITSKSHEQYLIDGQKSAITQKDNWNKLTEEERLSLQNKRLSGFYRDSKPNQEFAELLDKENIEYSKEYPLNGYFYDFKISNNLIEINPSSTHNSTWNPFNHEVDKDYHFNKTITANNNGFRCIHIFDWDNKNKIINLLKSRIRIYARDCEIKKVDLDKTRDYLNQFHLQGFIKSEINIGLYYKENLVSIMTFGKPRYNKNYEYELLRYCSNYFVIGGAEKLFKYFINTYNSNSIISYCDKSKFSGNVYTNLGFIFKSCKPSKHWYSMKTNQHITDNLLRQRGFDQLFGTNYGKGTSNEELMREAGFVEIYDAGQATYIWNK